MTKQTKKYSSTWDLDTIFSGGSSSVDFKRYMDEIEKDVKHFVPLTFSLESHSEVDFTLWKKVLDMWQDLLSRLEEADSFIYCLIAQNLRDMEAKKLSARLSRIESEFNTVLNKLDQLLSKMEAADWNKMLNDSSFKAVAFPLAEGRRRVKELLPVESENLAVDLAVDGYHAWENMYSNIVSRITIPYRENGSIQELSVGQAMNKLDHPDRAVRQQMFHLLNDAWEKEEDLLAPILNHICGFRLSLYRQRGWNSPLKEPLDQNRMSEETLSTMWDVIDQNKETLLQFVKRKANIIGVKKMAWYDVFVPIDQSESAMSYDEAVDTVLNKFHKFDLNLAIFAKKVFQQQWIEAEDRAGKRAGAFCTYFPDSGQSRIFSTFSGNSSIVSVLAHEIGHAYHQHVMRDLPQMIQNVGMCLSETASMFTERIILDATIDETTDKKQKILLLEEKIRQAVSCLLGKQARFLFETRFNEERKKGLVSVEQIKELTVQAQRDAFSDSLSEYHPWLWASRHHYYITEVPFYNFPYTFGYLFGLGLYKKSLEDGIGFSNQYVSLLQNTGNMSVEELAKKYLDVDLTRPEFWQGGIDLIKHDINQFLELTEQEV